MAKDMHTQEWDSATLTKLDVFEQYVHDWFNITSSYGQNEKFNALEIYNLFCGSGYDATGKYKGSPLRILDAILKRNLKGKTIKLYFNDNNEEKIKTLKEIINNEYKILSDRKDIKIKYTSVDTDVYTLYSQKYFKLVFLDQYGIKHIHKAQEFLTKGTDILIFIASSYIKRFLEEKTFKKYLDVNSISKRDFENKSNYETHRIITQYFKTIFKNHFIAPFSLTKDNGNTNGLIFISTHRKGQEQFLKTAWKIDENFGEGNKNIDRDFTKDETSLFYEPNEPSEKERRYAELLKEFLKEQRSNIEIKYFSLDNGFLSRHTNKILNSLKNHLECEYCNNAKRGFHLDRDEVKVKVRLK